MKKILFLLFAILTLSCCMPSEEWQKEMEKVENDKMQRPENKAAQRALGTGCVDRIYEFEYNGHKYIQFVNGKTYSEHKIGGVVHDPDCPCHKIEKSEENVETQNLNSESFSYDEYTNYY